ncbi:MAG: hypothetical protein GWP19_02660 [Planctomycetia bacterium]|nr:hypothetical protein [Planctomycetia bacterium]
MAILSIQNFQGMIPGSDFIYTLPLEGKEGEFARSVIDPNRFPGLLSPFPVATALTNAASITTPVTKMVNYIDSTPLIFCGGGDKIYEIVPSSDTVTNTGNFPHTITGDDITAATHSGHIGYSFSDMVIYENSDSGTATFEVFYSWNDNTDGDIGRLSAIPGTDTFEDDYWSATTAAGGAGGTVLNKNFPHPLAIAENNFLYIGDGSVLKSMDLRGTTPVVNISEIDLLGGWVIKDHISYKGYHWIAARETHTYTNPTTSQDGRTAIFVWDYVKSTFDEIYYLDDDDIYKIFVYKGTLHVITGGGSISNRVRKFNGTTFKTLPGAIYQYGNVTELGGIAQRHGILIWGSAHNGEVYSYGTIDETKPQKFNVIGDVGTSFNSIIQKPVVTETYYIGVDSSVKKYLFTIGGGFKGGVKFMSRMYKFPTNVTIQEFRVYYPAFSNSTGNSIAVQAFFNGKDAQITIGQISKTLLDTGYARIPYIKSDIYSINVALQWNTTDTAAGSDTILPYRIDVVYKPTKKR